MLKTDQYFKTKDRKPLTAYNFQKSLSLTLNSYPNSTHLQLADFFFLPVGILFDDKINKAY